MLPAAAVAAQLRYLVAGGGCGEGPERPGSAAPAERSPARPHPQGRNHVSAEARADYIAGAGASKDQLEEIVADEALALIDHSEGKASRA